VKNIEIVSTDSELEQRMAELQPYVEAAQAVVTTCRSVRLRDGSTEHAPEEVEGSAVIMPGRELRHNREAYNRRVDAFQEDCPDFAAIVGSSDLPITQAVHDEILRMPNGPDVTFFLAQYPSVANELFCMHPLDAATYVEEISQELVRAKAPGEELDIAAWLKQRNQSERKGKSNAKRQRA
jgi:hypothetical protein